MSGPRHIPVLLQSVLSELAITPEGTYFDGTLGGGGHAAEIISRLGPHATFIGVDKDERILAETRERLTTTFPNGTHGRIVCEVRAFENARDIVARAGVSELSGALLDLGWGSHTLDSGKGFSFMKDEPLVMTYTTKEAADFTAHDVVNTWGEAALADVIYAWGEEPHARKIAKAIVRERERMPIETSGQLAELVERCIPKRGKTHPATRVFQALRIAVNREMEILPGACSDLLDILTPRGRLCIITFHSGEDRIIKQLFNEWHVDGRGIHRTKHVIAPAREEVQTNPRARSAKLRVFEKN